MRISSLSLSAILCCVLSASVCHAQATLIFASNYDLALIVNGELSRSRSRVVVRNESTFPIQFHKHKIEITVSAISEEQYKVDLRIFEKSLGTWFEIYSDFVRWLVRHSDRVQMA